MVEPTKPVLDNHTYDVGKNAVMTTLPAVTTLYLAIAAIWNWPHTEQIALTLTAVTTFVGVVLRVLSKNYNENEASAKFAGTIDVTEKPDGRQSVLFAFKNDEVAENLASRDEVVFKVNRVQ